MINACMILKKLSPTPPPPPPTKKKLRPCHVMSFKDINCVVYLDLLQ